MVCQAVQNGGTGLTRLKCRSEPASFANYITLEAVGSTVFKGFKAQSLCTMPRNANYPVGNRQSSRQVLVQSSH